MSLLNFFIKSLWSRVDSKEDVPCQSAKGLHLNEYDGFNMRISGLPEDGLLKHGIESWCIIQAWPFMNTMDSSHLLYFNSFV